ASSRSADRHHPGTTTRVTTAPGARTPGPFRRRLEPDPDRSVRGTMSLYDPLDPGYLDPVATRAERDRTFQACSDCRICVRLCPSFRSLFEMVDANENGADDVTVLTDRQHDRVVEECYQCKLCYVVCPYVPEREQELVIDFPRLML